MVGRSIIDPLGEARQAAIVLRPRVANNLGFCVQRRGRCVRKLLEFLPGIESERDASLNRFLLPRHHGIK